MLDALLMSLPRLAQLAIPALLGALAARLGVFEDPRRAIAHLNLYAITIAFPALIAKGLIGADVALPRAPMFYLLWPLVLVVLLASARLIPRLRPHAGTIALISTFANVAYLGLPYVTAVFGEEIAGPAALVVSIHVVGAVSLGPALLVAWSESEEETVTLRSVAAKLVRMPLFWSPFAGLLLRAFPDAVQNPALAAISPLAASAAPVALFLLGMHVWVERAHLLKMNRRLFGHLTLRVVLAPSVALGLSAIAYALGWLAGEWAALHVVLAAMPAAITTFSMAHDADVGVDLVAATIVWSTILAVGMLPVWTGIVSALFLS